MKILRYILMVPLALIVLRTAIVIVADVFTLFGSKGEVSSYGIGHLVGSIVLFILAILTLDLLWRKNRGAKKPNQPPEPTR